jgi:biotin carboxylase
LLLLPTSTYRTTAFIAAARRLDIDLTVASERPSTFQGARPEALLTLDFGHLDQAVAGAVAFHRRYPLTGALGVDDDTAIVAAAINVALGHGGNPVDAVKGARDKHRQRLACAAARVPGPAFALHELGAPLPAITFPVVIKPLRLAASRGVIRADDARGLEAALARVQRILGTTDAQVLIEEFVPGVEVAVEGLLVSGRFHTLAVFDKPDPLDGPFFEETIYVAPSRLPAPELQQITSAAAAGAAAIGLHEGPVHAEVRLNARGPWLIELAARPIGGRCSAALRFRSGASLEEIICRHALRLPLASLDREACASGVMMIPVPGSGVLREVRGVAAATAVPLVESLEITAHPGERLVPWPEGSRYPGFIFARGETPAGVEAALRAAHARLEFILDPT